MRKLSRTGRMALAGAAAMTLSGCLTHESITEDAFAPDPAEVASIETQISDESAFGAPPPPDSIMNYAAVDDGGFHLVEIPVDKVDPRFLRQRVPYAAGEHAIGTVIVDTPNRFLYVIEENGMAMRYGVAVGGSGLSWKGEAKVGTKREWPSWHPPAEMIQRKPELEPYKDGMPPGLTNPLGARALYLYADGKDTLYRLHGTAEWWTIGTAASSGCIRLMNQDAIDLFNRVAVNTKVVVLQGNEALVGEDPNAIPDAPPLVADASSAAMPGYGGPPDINGAAAPQGANGAAPAGAYGAPAGYGGAPPSDPYAMAPSGAAGDPYAAGGYPPADPYATTLGGPDPYAGGGGYASDPYASGDPYAASSSLDPYAAPIQRY